MSNFRQSVFNDHSFNPNLLTADLRTVDARTRDLLNRSVQWTRAEEIYGNFGPNLFREIDPKVIGPSTNIPEYTFWKVLRHMASHPELVRSVFVIRDEERSGRYSMYVWKDNSRVEVEIDTVIPTINGQHAFCQVTSSDIWPILFEKAVVKAYGSLAILFGRKLLIRT